MLDGSTDGRAAQYLTRLDGKLFWPSTQRRRKSARWHISPGLVYLLKVQSSYREESPPQMTRRIVSSFPLESSLISCVLKAVDKALQLILSNGCSFFRSEYYRTFEEREEKVGYV